MSEEIIFVVWIFFFFFPSVIFLLSTYTVSINYTALNANVTWQSLVIWAVSFSERISWGSIFAPRFMIERVTE